MPLDAMTEAINTFTELKRMHQLNLELLEQLNASCSWIREHNVPIPNAEALASLLNKALTLADEIQADAPKILQYQVSGRKVTPNGINDGTDEEVTEPD